VLLVVGLPVRLLAVLAAVRHKATPCAGRKLGSTPKKINLLFPLGFEELIRTVECRTLAWAAPARRKLRTEPTWKLKVFGIRNNIVASVARRMDKSLSTRHKSITSKEFDTRALMQSCSILLRLQSNKYLSS